MSEFSTLPNFEMLLYNRIQQKNVTPKQDGAFNPCDLLTKRKNGEETIPEIQQWPEDDVKALQDYCQKMGIAAVSSRLNPRYVLNMLKSKHGDVDYSGVPIQERIPPGYQKIGMKNQSNNKDLLCG
jgi:hypothetical protein